MRGHSQGHAKSAPGSAGKSSGAMRPPAAPPAAAQRPPDMTPPELGPPDTDGKSSALKPCLSLAACRRAQHNVSHLLTRMFASRHTQMEHAACDGWMLQQCKSHQIDCGRTKLAMLQQLSLATWSDISIKTQAMASMQLIAIRWPRITSTLW